MPGPRGTEGRTWSVIDRWPTHPLLIKVPIILVHPVFTCPNTCQTFAENIKKELATFSEEKRGKVGVWLLQYYPCSLLIAFTFLRNTFDLQVVILFSAHSVPQYVMDRGDPYPAEVESSWIRFTMYCDNIFRWVPQSAWWWTSWAGQTRIGLCGRWLRAENSCFSNFSPE